MTWQLSRLPSAAASAVRPVAAALGGALPFLRRMPWFGWAGLGVGAVVLLGSGKAAAATAGGGGVVAKPAGTPPLLKLGSSGPWVSYLQSKLGVSVTGTFDAGTDTAVRALQTDKGLGVDGVVGGQTWGVLGVTGGGGGSAPAPGPVAPAVPAVPAVPAPAPAPSSGNPFGLAQTVPEREAQILAYVADGAIDHMFVPLTWSKNGHTITAFVSRRALALSDGTNRLVVNMSFRNAQKVADQLGAHMLTSRVADEIWNQAPTKIGILSKNWNLVNPVNGQTLPEADGSGGKTNRMYDQSNQINAKVAAAGDTGLVANEGKDWVITRRFWNPPEGTGVENGEGNSGSRHNGANFGWYPGGSKTPGGLPVIQSVGLAHEKAFTDYSQLLRFMLPTVTVDGTPMTSAEVLADPALSYLLNDEGGIVPGTRHPDL